MCTLTAIFTCVVGSLYEAEFFINHEEAGLAVETNVQGDQPRHALFVEVDVVAKNKKWSR